MHYTFQICLSACVRRMWWLPVSPKNVRFMRLHARRERARARMVFWLRQGKSDEVLNAFWIWNQSRKRLYWRRSSSSACRIRSFLNPRHFFRNVLCLNRKSARNFWRAYHPIIWMRLSIQHYKNRLNGIGPAFLEKKSAMSNFELIFQTKFHLICDFT